MSSYHELKNAAFITVLNSYLNLHNVPSDIALIINEYIIADKINFKPHAHNPYSVEDGLGIIEQFSGPVDVADPVYVEYVNTLRTSINSLASIIKVLNRYINDCEFNKWIELNANIDSPYRHNFHKLIAAVRHDLVFDYNELIALRVYWKGMYKAVRSYNQSNLSPSTVH